MADYNMENRVFKCLLCSHFQALSLRNLLNHYRTVHSNQSSFFVTCNVDGCPATFTLYNSLHRHVTRKHKDVYQGIINPRNQANETETDDEIGQDIIGNDFFANEYEPPSDPDSSSLSSSSSEEEEEEDNEQEDHDVIVNQGNEDHDIVSLMQLFQALSLK